MNRWCETAAAFGDTARSAPMPSIPRVATVATVKTAAAPLRTVVLAPAPVVSRPAPIVAPPAPALKAGGVTASTANFLDAGAPKVIAPPLVLAPVKSAAQLAAEQAAAKARADASLFSQQQQLKAQNLATREAMHERETADYDYLMATDPTFRANAEYLASAGTDWGLIPLGAKVIGAGVAILGSAGVLTLPAAGGVIGATVAAVGADKIVAAVEKGGAIAVEAKNIVENTVNAAKAGVADAQRGLDVLNDVAAVRAAKNVPVGTTQTVAPATAVAVAVASIAPAAVPAPMVQHAPVVSASPSGRRPTAVFVPQGGSSVVATLPRWLVSDAGRIYSGSQRAAVGAGGWAVYGDGKVARA